MHHRNSVHSVYFSTVNCWRIFCKTSELKMLFFKFSSLLFLICLLFSFSSNAQTNDSLSLRRDSSSAQGDSLSNQKDSLLVDSLQYGNDLKSKEKYTADDSIVYDIPGEKIFLYGT